MLKVKSRPNLFYFSRNERPYGHSFGEWTVKWWQWAVSSPTDLNPVTDNTGKNGGVNQSGPVWFLAGTLGENRAPIRKCKIPFGKALLFPVINYEITQLENPELKTKNAMVKHVVNDIDDIIKREAMIDGMKIPSYRVQSSPKVFPLNVCDDNWLGIAGGLINSAADGYWVFLKPLQPGIHEIFFHGSCSGGIRNSTATYLLDIVV